MQDRFSTHAAGLTGPARSAHAVTPDDATDLPFLTRALYVGQGGDLRVTMADGDVVTFTGLSGGGIYALRVGRVHATGTSAGGVVALE